MIVQLFQSKAMPPALPSPVVEQLIELTLYMSKLLVMNAKFELTSLVSIMNSKSGELLEMSFFRALTVLGLPSP
jgi:hypothetical protein